MAWPSAHRAGRSPNRSKGRCVMLIELTWTTVVTEEYRAVVSLATFLGL